MRLVSWVRWAVLGLAGLTAAGCSSDPHRPHPVRGVVVYEDGQPAKELAGGSVSFSPLSTEPLGSSIGKIEEDGSFRLSCLRENDGAVAGRHQVTITPPEPADQDDDRPAARRARPRVVIDPATAVQEVTVEPKSNEITLKVRRAKSAR
jgi:hypothetical protein